MAAASAARSPTRSCSPALIAPTTARPFSEVSRTFARAAGPLRPPEMFTNAGDVEFVVPGAVAPWARAGGGKMFVATPHRRKRATCARYRGFL